MEHGGSRRVDVCRHDRAGDGDRSRPAGRHLRAARLPRPARGHTARRRTGGYPRPAHPRRARRVPHRPGGDAGGTRAGHGDPRHGRRGGDRRGPAPASDRFHPRRCHPRQPGHRARVQPDRPQACAAGRQHRLHPRHRRLSGDRSRTVGQRRPTPAPTPTRCCVPGSRRSQSGPASTSRSSAPDSPGAPSGSSCSTSTRPSSRAR